MVIFTTRRRTLKYVRRSSLLTLHHASQNRQLIDTPYQSVPRKFSQHPFHPAFSGLETVDTDEPSKTRNCGYGRKYHKERHWNDREAHEIGNASSCHPPSFQQTENRNTGLDIRWKYSVDASHHGLFRSFQYVGIRQFVWILPDLLFRKVQLWLEHDLLDRLCPSLADFFYWRFFGSATRRRVLQIHISCGVNIPVARNSADEFQQTILAPNDYSRGFDRPGRRFDILPSDCTIGVLLHHGQSFGSRRYNYRKFCW